jgi:hypothetical protein
VQWRDGAAPGSTRGHRRELLAAQLRRALAGEPSVDVRWDTLSVSGQTVEAQVDDAEFDRVVSDLRARGLRVDQVLDRHVV